MPKATVALHTLNTHAAILAPQSSVSTRDFFAALSEHVPGIAVPPAPQSDLERFKDALAARDFDAAVRIAPYLRDQIHELMDMEERNRAELAALDKSAAGGFAGTLSALAAKHAAELAELDRKFEAELAAQDAKHSAELATLRAKCEAAEMLDARKLGIPSLADLGIPNPNKPATAASAPQDTATRTPEQVRAVRAFIVSRFE